MAMFHSRAQRSTSSSARSWALMRGTLNRVPRAVRHISPRAGEPKVHCPACPDGEIGRRNGLKAIERQSRKRPAGSRQSRRNPWDVPRQRRANPDCVERPAGVESGRWGPKGSFNELSWSWRTPDPKRAIARRRKSWRVRKSVGRKVMPVRPRLGAPTSKS